ncbi:MAG TPA: hypothetical protein VFI61_04595 [Patescibacteria group bacterium]|nr:hypothetical protein [Patescibacteria group bacterium]
MNKKVIIAVVVLLLLAVAGVAYSKMKSGGAVPGGTTAGGVTSGSKSLKDLLTSGVAQKCTYSTTTDNMTSSGTTYISNGKVRGDFSSTVSGKTTASHMIVDGKTNYIWTDGTKTGFKTTVEDSTTTTNTSGNTSGEFGDLNQKSDYKCSAWVVDSSYFTPPADVAFSDFSALMNPSAVPTSGQSGNSTQCSYCNSLTGSDKTQCLSALNCK